MAPDTDIHSHSPCILDYVNSNESIYGQHVTFFGCSSMETWEIVLSIVSLIIIIIVTVIGNVLVIMSVCTYRPLRTAQNFFIVSLAVADLTVALLVLPFNIAYITMGRWVFGSYICQMWLTCDILCCTASILNLSAIALDRYWAITDPINYANKRTLKLVLSMIAGVWAASFLICLPPLFGWNDWPDEFTIEEPCKLSEKRGFVLFSSMGSFYIPLVVILIVYAKIFRAIRRRTRERAKQSKIKQMSSTKLAMRAEDSVLSDNGQNGMNENGKHRRPSKDRFLKNKLLVATNSEKKNSERHLCPSNANNAGGDESTSENERHAQEEPLSPTALHPDLKTTDIVVQIAPGGANQIHQFIEERQKISLSKERRAARTLGIIVGVFIVCWLPFFLMYVIRPFCLSCPPLGERWENFITWLGYINSSLNPVIYTIFNEEYRKAFSKLIRCSKLTT